MSGRRWCLMLKRIQGSGPVVEASKNSSVIIAGMNGDDVIGVEAINIAMLMQYRTNGKHDFFPAYEGPIRATRLQGHSSVDVYLETQ